MAAIIPDFSIHPSDLRSFRSASNKSLIIVFYHLLLIIVIFCVYCGDKDLIFIHSVERLTHKGDRSGKFYFRYCKEMKKPQENWRNAKEIGIHPKNLCDLCFLFGLILLFGGADVVGGGGGGGSDGGGGGAFFLSTDSFPGISAII